MAGKTMLVQEPVDTSCDDELDHVVCCIDGDSRTFCGLDGARLDWVKGEQPCVVCAAMEDTDACPAGGICVQEAI